MSTQSEADRFWEQMRALLRERQGQNRPSTRRDKLRRLRRITIERGATPAEASAAAGRVPHLEKQYRRYGENLRKACRDVDKRIGFARSILCTAAEVAENEKRLQADLRKLIEEANKLIDRR